MAYTVDENEWESLKPGHLDEREHDGLGLVDPRVRAAQAMYIRTTVFFLGREKAPLPKAPKIAARLGAVLAGNGSSALVSTFHMRHDFVSRDPSPTPEPSACRRGKAIAIHPYTKKHVALARRFGKFDQASRTYIVPVGQNFLQTRIARQLQSETAKALRQKWLAGRSVGQSRISATEFQAYISRVGLSAEDREKVLDSDERGIMDFGTLGATHDERNGFWRAVDGYETQERARIQSRVEFELPYAVSSSCRREIAEKFGEFLTGEGLPFSAAVHRPGSLSDPRSFHMHLVYHNRQIVADTVDFAHQTDGSLRVVRGEPIFSPKKHRSHQGEAWLKRLREEFANIVNDVLAREAVRTRQLPPFFFFPGTYAELGIDVVPQQHMGARRTAVERRGGSTRRGGKNDEILEDRVARRIDKAIKKIEINLRRVAFDKRSRHDASQRDDLGSEFRRIVGLCERAIQGLTKIEIALAEPPTRDGIDLLIASLRKLGFVPVDLSDLLHSGTALEIPVDPDRSPLPLHAQSDSEQLGRLAAIAKLFFLHQLEIAALALETHVVRRKGNFIPATARAPMSIALSDRMRPPLPTVGVISNVTTNPRKPRISNLDLVSWLDVSDDWRPTAVALGAIRNPISQKWFAPASLSSVARQMLVKFFGSIESKIAQRVAVERRSAELASRQTPDPQTQASKPIASAKSGSYLPRGDIATLATPQTAKTNPPVRTPLASPPSIVPRAAERGVFRPVPGPSTASPAAGIPTPSAQPPSIREDLTRHLTTASYDFGVRMSDPEVRRTNEARARRFTSYELFYAYSLTRRLADTLAALPFNSPDRRGFAAQGDYASGMRLLEEELYRRNLYFTDLEKRFRSATPTQPIPTPTTTGVAAQPPVTDKRNVHNTRGGRER